jgi:signal transduction histidine kinase
MQTARLPEPLARGLSGHPSHDAGPFRSLSRHAPFPRGGGGPRRSGPRIEVRLDPGPTAAAEARAATTVLDGHADGDVLDDLRLLLSEIVTNSVRHAGSPHGAKIDLSVTIDRGGVRAEVADSGRGFEPSPRDAPQLQAGGWGLHLVDRLAARWGVDRGARVRVWFELDPSH